MNKTKLIALMTGVVVTGLSFGSAHAEFVLGVQGGFSSSQNEVVRTFANGTTQIEPLPGEGGGNALGLFGQYRHTLNNNVLLGVHLGYTADSAEWQRSGDFLVSDTRIDPSGNRTVVDRFNFQYKADSVYDVLGLVGYSGQKVTPFVMFGLSNMKVKSSWAGVYGSFLYDVGDDATLSGWKLATGVEFPFSDKLVGHVLLHYADYGKATLNDGAGGTIISPRTLAVKQTGIRFGIGYRF